MTVTEKQSYSRALAFAEEKHSGQFRMGGEPYISHPVEVAKIVADWGYGIEYQITALFHDLLEDTDATEQEILSLSSERVLCAVKLLTKQKGYVMSEYVSAIKNDPIAFAVKGADRLHNLRTALCTDNDFKRKYILESVDWYLDFSKEIPPAVKALAQSLDAPMTELSFLYEPVETWKIKI